MPSLKAASTAFGVMGTLVYGWYYGVIYWIDGVLGFYIGQITGAESFTTGLLDQAFRGITRFMSLAAYANAEFLLDLGLIGILVGLAEGIAVIYLIIGVVTKIPQLVIRNL